MDSETLTPSEAGALIGYSGRQITRWCESGYITATRRPGPRGDWQIPQAEIQRLIDAASAGSGNPQ